MSKDLIIIGASGHGKVVADVARQMTENGKKRYSAIRFLDDDKTKTACGPYPVIGTTENMEQYLGMDYFVAIGNADIRKRIAKQLESFHAAVPVFVHPKAIVGENVSVGKGTVVVGGAVINTGASIGEYCIINTGATVDHDCRIGDYVHIATGAHICGTVDIGSKTWVGAGAIVSNNLSICNECLIGAGTTVIHTIDRRGTYAGVPAKMLKASSP